MMSTNLDRIGVSSSRATKPRGYVKRWSYAQITAHAEQEITRHMGKARELRATDHSASLHYSAWAYGIYLAWYSLCVGWMTPGDEARLRALTEY